MFISDESNMIKDDSANHPITRPSRSGSMNPNLIPILIVIGIVQVLLIGYWVFPRAASLYYQSRAGQVVDRVLSGGQMTQWDSIACASPPASNDSSRASLKKAIEDLNKAIRFSPESAHPQLLLGRAYCMLGDPENAIEAYQAHVDLRPANPLGHLELGFAYEAACQAELRLNGGEERGRPEQQRCDIPEYQEPMIVSWKNAGLSVQDFIDTGEMARKSGRLDEALVWFRRGSEFSPEAGAPWFYIGELYASKEEISTSTDAYLAAFERGYTESVSSLVDIYSSTGENTSLIGILTLSLERFPDHQDRVLWWNLLGKEYLQQMDWESAVQSYEQAILEFPENPQLHVYLGQAYYESGQGVEKAFDQVERAIELDPDIGIAFYTFARILTREKRYAEADVWYERALEKIPAENWWRLARANAARASGNLSLAEQEYLTIVERSENFVSAYYELAWLYRLLGKMDQAIESIEKAISMTSTPKQEYYIRAGEIYELAGNIDNALVAYKEALALNPNNPVAKSKVETLSNGEN